MKVGKYEIKIGQDKDGRTIFYLVETVTEKIEPGEYYEMSLAVIAGLLKQY